MDDGVGIPADRLQSIFEAFVQADVTLTREHADRRTFWVDVVAAIARARPRLTGLAVPAAGPGSLGGSPPSTVYLIARYVEPQTR